MRPAHLKTASELGANKPHGTRVKYMGGCRCLPCRAANSNYETGRAAKRRLGLDNGIVPARRAQQHLMKLAKQGVGRRSVAEATGIPHSSIFKIRKGTKTHIRKDTERRILSVSVKHAIGKALIDARPTWKLINELLDEGGFTKSLLAKRMGFSTRAIQLGKERITAKNARRVRRFYDRIMAI